MKKLNLIKKRQEGFTLIELMIVIAIIAILATVAIPSYQNYTKKAAMSELLQASSSYKTEVEICTYNLGDKANCNEGSNGIQAKNSNGSKYVASVSVAAGVITVKGKDSLDGYGYTLTPTLNDNAISWAAACEGTDKSLFPAGFCNG